MVLSSRSLQSGRLFVNSAYRRPSLNVIRACIFVVNLPRIYAFLCELACSMRDVVDVTDSSCAPPHDRKFVFRREIVGALVPTVPPLRNRLLIVDRASGRRRRCGIVGCRSEAPPIRRSLSPGCASFPASFTRMTDCSQNRPQPVSRDHQVRKGEQTGQLRRILEQPLVAHLTMMEQVCDDMKWMLDPCADLRLGSLEFDHQILQPFVRQAVSLLQKVDSKHSLRTYR
ncbi:hypothetical protein BSE24067_06514 [Burkholderia seminalis]|nr:hypothetical protein BSE24067_06514 [Burkholderia seminalis]